MANADFVVTDSFHGMVWKEEFSLIGLQDRLIYNLKVILIKINSLNTLSEKSRTFYDRYIFLPSATELVQIILI